MDKKLFKGNIIVSIICILSMFFCYIPTTYAKDLPVKDYLTNIRVSNTEIKNGGDVTISVQWHDRQDAPIRGGDTLTINFPEGDGVSSRGHQSSGNLTMFDGTVVGTIVVEPDKAVLTFNDQINQYIGQSVYGTVNCSFRIWDKKTSDGTDHTVKIPITGNHNYNPTITIKGQNRSSGGSGGHQIVSYEKPWIKKEGVKSYTNGKEAWEIDGSLGSLKDATVTDNIGQGIKLLEDTIRVQIIYGDYQYLTVKQFEDKGYGTVTINPNDKGFTVKFNLKALNQLADKYNHPGVGFNIIYNTKTEEPITFVGPKYLNSAIINATNKDNEPVHKEVVASLKNFSASWTVEGSKNALHVQKLDAETMQPVEGAVITIYNQETGKMTEGTTDSKGLVVFSNLQPGDYTLAETKAPKGYKINEQLYLFKVDKDYTVSGFKGTNGKYNMDPVVFDQKESTTPTKPSSSTSTSKSSSSTTTTTTTKTTVTKPSKSSSTTKTTSTTKPSKSSSTTKTTSTSTSKSSSTTKTTSTKPSKSSSTTKTTSTKPSKSSSTTKTTSTSTSKSSSTTTKPAGTTSSSTTSTTTKPAGTTSTSTTSTTTKPAGTTSTSTTSTTTKPAGTTGTSTTPTTTSKSKGNVVPPVKPDDKGDHSNKGPKGPKGDQGDKGPKGPKGDQGDKGPKGPAGDQGNQGQGGNQGNGSNQGSTGETHNTTTTPSNGGSAVNHNNDKGNNSSDNHGWLPQTGSKKAIVPLTGLGLLLIAIAVIAMVYARKRKER